MNNLLSFVTSSILIKDRIHFLQLYLKNSTDTILSDIDNTLLKEIFDMFYTPDIGESKYHPSEINYFYIDYHPIHKTKCFHIKLINGDITVATLKRLSGSNRTQTQNITRALRLAIQPQIDLFKLNHPLIQTDICPIKHIPLGHDAQVDHYLPTFSTLVKNWLKDNQNPQIHTIKGFGYELDEPFKSNWISFHASNSKLRWLSKLGNQTSHL